MSDEESSGELLKRLGTDARLWAGELSDVLDVAGADPLRHTIMTWCANMIEVGRSAGYAQAKEEADARVQSIIERAAALDTRRQEQVANQKASIDRLMKELEELKALEGWK